MSTKCKRPGFRLMSVQEIVDRAHLAEATVRLAIHRGELQARALCAHGSWRVSQAAYRGWVRRKEPKPVPGDPDALLPLDEVATLSGYSERTIREQLKSGKLNGKKLGRLWRIRLADYADWAGIDFKPTDPDSMQEENGKECDLTDISALVCSRAFFMRSFIR